MKPVRFMLNATSLAMLAIFSGSVLAHAEHDKPRYVSSTGLDKGACDSLENPCLTFRYAATQSNKGDQILVAAGQYAINDPDSLFYLLSDIVPVKAGFSTADGFKQRDQQKNRTYLTGVPLEYAPGLRAKGFDVNTDMKQLSAEDAAVLALKMSQYKSLTTRQSNVGCVDGKAGEFDCNNVDLLAHVPLADFAIESNRANDIWGYIDLNTRKEYAIIGLNNGVSVVDVSVPTVPVVVGSLTSLSTTWRDIKVHQYYDHNELRWKAYAYVTADSARVGMMIVDLNDLTSGISIVEIDRTDLDAHNVFMSNVDYSTGVTLTSMTPYLHMAGADAGKGAFNTYNLGPGSTTVDTLFRPGNNGSYSHDVSSMVISDDRIGSQCSPVDGQCEIFFDYNVDRVKIWDKTNNSTPTWLSNITYQQATYVHSGWSTENKNVVLVHDEIDEQAYDLNTTVRLFDISDLQNPQPLSVWTGPTKARDHNGFVRGSRYYMSNYTQGLTILDISDPANPAEVGNFDSYPLDDSLAFNGAWGVYPFLPSGTIIVSDVNSGLYVLGDKTVGTPSQDSVSFDAAYYATEEGIDTTITVSRSGDASKAVTVQYETHVGSADTDDFTMTHGTIEWSAGDSGDKQITIAANTDTLDQEYDENLFVRLYNPTDGLSLAAPSLSIVNVNGLALPSFASFTSEDIEAKETDGSLMIPVKRSGDFSEALTVSYDLSLANATPGSDFEFTPGTLHWGPGEASTKHIELTLVDDDESENNETIVLNLIQDGTGGVGQITVTLRDDESNEAPVVTVSGDMSVNAGSVISLAAAASDPEDRPLTYQWSQTAGTTVSMPNSTSSSTAVTAPAVAGSLVFSVTVTDDFGASASASVNVTVTVPDTSSGGSSGGGGALWLFPLAGLLIGWRRRLR